MVFFIVVYLLDIYIDVSIDEGIKRLVFYEETVVGG